MDNGFVLQKYVDHISNKTIYQVIFTKRLLSNAVMLLGLVLYKSHRNFQNKEQSRAILTRIKNNENQILA